MIGQIDRLIREVIAHHEPLQRGDYWVQQAELAREELTANELAFDDQSRELDIAVGLLEELGPEHALEYRRRAYPTLYPREIV